MRSDPFATSSWLALTLAGALAAPGLPAQCATVPNTGCGQVTGCIGTTTIGQTFQVFCSVGGSFRVFLGACAPAPITIPAGIMCTAPCNFGIDLTVHVVLSGPIAVVSIPADPRLIGATLCVQCVPSPDPFLRCFRFLSSATRFTIVP